ncbi:hypothetical protein [Denitromonas ohlonensis]|uniref:Uncharacterized protein n=2 Tax=Denitromonas TaxID=139331 RepID=A0A557REI1_9RHOO|nr:hypothetical protein [Denitromonas ohlonensis]TVO63538.1 hypothetical protein FHP90_13730 [Denitromonas ohlonensis]TVO75415.1 hypothetical protein FHP89_13765 [Denitromonas ohlonensis]
MDTTDFNRFLDHARAKATPQRLYLVFAEKEYATEAEIAAGEATASSYSIRPLMYADKALSALGDFDELLAESLENGQAWDLVYVSASDDEKLSADFVEERLEVMVKLIQQGEGARFVIFDQLGAIYRLDKLSTVH